MYTTKNGAIAIFFNPEMSNVGRLAELIARRGKVEDARDALFTQDLSGTDFDERLRQLTVLIDAVTNQINGKKSPLGRKNADQHFF